VVSDHHSLPNLTWDNSTITEELAGTGAYNQLSPFFLFHVQQSDRLLIYAIIYIHFSDSTTISLEDPVLL